MKAVTYEAMALMANRTKTATRQKARGTQRKPTMADTAAEYFKALCVPSDAIPRLVAKVKGRGVLFAECDRLADKWRRDQGGCTWLEILRGNLPASLPSLVSYRANVALWRGWYRNSPGDFLDLAGKLRDLWKQASCIEGMGPPPPLPAEAAGVMRGGDPTAIEVALEALDSLLRWCDGEEQCTVPAAADTSGGDEYLWLDAAEAAVYVGRCPKTIVNWLQGDRLHSFGQSGKRYQFLKAELDAKKSARKCPRPR